MLAFCQIQLYIYIDFVCLARAHAIIARASASMSRSSRAIRSWLLRVGDNCFDQENREKGRETDRNSFQFTELIVKNARHFLARQRKFCCCQQPSWTALLPSSRVNNSIVLFMEASSIAASKPAAAVVDLTAPKADDSLMSPAANMTQQTVAVSPEEEEEQEQIEEEEELQFLGSVKFTIVGIRYYTGKAHAGEFVSLAREPRNPYDRNAIRVDNMSGQKVGHIKREQAAALAPILDDASLDVQVDGTIPYPGNQWNLPVTLEFYGRDVSLSLQVARILKRHRIGLQGAPVSDTSSSSSSTVAKPSVVVQKKTIDWKTQQKQLDDMFDEQSKTQLSNLPQIEMPAALQVELFDYQMDGVRWMFHRETGHIEPPFYKQVTEGGKTVWLSEITNASQPTPPKSVAGGILAGT